MSKMSKHEWGILIGIMIFIDILQGLLSAFGIGLAINRFSNIAIGILLNFYLAIRGVSFVSPKKFISMGTAFVGEMLVIGDFLPMWTAATIITCAVTIGEENPDSKLGKATKVLRVAEKFKKPLNKDGVRLPTGRDTI